MRSPVRYVSLGFQSGSLGLSHTFEVIRISVVIEVSMEKWARETAQKVPVGRTLIIFFRLTEKDVKEYRELCKNNGYDNVIMYYGVLFKIKKCL